MVSPELSYNQLGYTLKWLHKRGENKNEQPKKWKIEEKTKQRLRENCNPGEWSPGGFHVDR